MPENEENHPSVVFTSVVVLAALVCVTVVLTILTPPQEESVPIAPSVDVQRAFPLSEAHDSALLLEYHHPELREGEIFLGNFLLRGTIAGPRSPWKTKRVGDYAYDANGGLRADACARMLKYDCFVPVFVQLSELEEAGISTLPN